MNRTRWYAAAAVVLELAAAITLATVAVALLEHVASVAGLAVIYLLAVLWVAIRRGELPAIATAVGSVITMNFFFIEPRYQFRIAESEHLAALVVLLIAALVVGRLASSARGRAEEAAARAQVADAREREARLLAEAATSLLAGGPVDRALGQIGQRLGEAIGAPARIMLAGTPSAGKHERALRLPTSRQSAWLVVGRDGDAEVAGRLVEPLGRLLDVGLARQELDDRAAQAAQARRADAAKTAVLQAVSHDLRSPLTAILTAASGLRGDGLAAADRDELLTVLDAEGQRLSRLVADLLDLSRIEAGAAHPRADWCDLRDVVSGAAEQVRAARGAHPVEIDLPDELPLVRADGVQLERVFFNLIENAVKFSPPDAVVRVTGAATPTSVTVRVTDRGRGIPSSKRPDVFEPFFRGRGDGSGSGLGLAICRGFVEANGGRIALQTRRGAGTAFAVTLPLPAEAPAPVSA